MEEGGGEVGEGGKWRLEEEVGGGDEEIGR